MVLLIEALYEMKEYKIETLFLAVNLADRYLVFVAFHEAEVPYLVTLAMTCILVAAKLEQPVSPSFVYMIKLLADTQETVIEKQNLLDLEEKIIKMLDFSL